MCPISGSLRELTWNQHDEFAAGEMGYVGPDPHIGGATKIFWSEEMHFLLIPFAGSIRSGKYIIFTEISLCVLSESISWAFTSNAINLWSLLILKTFQVILSRMIIDILKFCFLYLLVLFAFSCGKKIIKSLRVNEILCPDTF